MSPKLSLRVPRELRDELVRLAKIENRSLSNFIATELEIAVAKMRGDTSAIGIAAESTKPAADAPVMLPGKITAPYPVRQRRKKAQGE